MTIKQPILIIAISALLSMVFGLFLAFVGAGPMEHTVPVSVLIGVVAASVPQIVYRVRPALTQKPVAHIVGIILATIVGLAVIIAWLAPNIERFPRAILLVVFGTVIFGGLLSATFFQHRRRSQLEDQLHQAELRKLEAENRCLQAQYKMLQAQIEPHFLFNTLANLVALVSSDPALAGQLLDRLIVYLRAALARTRSNATTLADEVEMLQAYLEITRIRMGTRLSYVLDVSDKVLATSFPPMLLQPLVENAVKHGLEPKVSNGVIRITGIQNQSRLRISVEDDGVGWNDAGECGNGTGIANVRARLSALYGDRALLMLEQNRLGGITVTLELPATLP